MGLITMLVPNNRTINTCSLPFYFLTTQASQKAFKIITFLCPSPDQILRGAEGGNLILILVSPFLVVGGFINY